MSQAALLLAGLSLLLGLWPLGPQSSTLGLIGASLGFLPAIGALLLALTSRGRALRDGSLLPIHTAAVALAVLPLVLCGFWLLAISYYLLRH